MPHRKTQSESSSILGTEIVRVLVGPRKRTFAIHKQLLCSTSLYFRENLEAIPAGLRSNNSCVDGRGRSLSSSAGAPPRPAPANDIVLWFSDESPEMFELFILWLYQRRRGFSSFVDEALAVVSAEITAAGEKPTPEADAACRDLHWAIVNLHIFAATLGLPALQDVAMDALQDLYLKLDWDISPNFVEHLYLTCNPDAAFRLRKWAVAMVAWTLSSASSSSRYSAAPCSSSVVARFQALFDRIPELDEDYSAHLAKMASSRANVCIKNPQLRIPTNALRNEERHFGFRLCSFHSHRATVGQGRCPHRKGPEPPSLSVTDIPMTMTAGWRFDLSPTVSESSCCSEARKKNDSALPSSSVLPEFGFF